jgi:hypothetical protein
MGIVEGRGVIAAPSFKSGQNEFIAKLLFYVPLSSLERVAAGFAGARLICAARAFVSPK